MVGGEMFDGPPARVAIQGIQAPLVGIGFQAFQLSAGQLAKIARRVCQAGVPVGPLLGVAGGLLQQTLGEQFGLQLA